MAAKTTKIRSAARHAPESLEWLMARTRGGDRRIDRLEWKRLAAIHRSRKATLEIRRAIEQAARRCGYDAATILFFGARWH